MIFSDVALILSIVLNVVLGIGCFYYAFRPHSDGSLDIEEFPDGGKRYSLNLETDLDAIDTQKRIVLKVNPLS